MKMNRNSLVFVPLVVCFPVIANAIEDYTPFVRPTLEQATDDADWIAWFNYEQGHLSLKKELKGRLPENWNADLALPSHYHPKQWAMVKHADFFVFGLNCCSSAKADTIRIALRGLSLDTINLLSPLPFHVHLDLQSRFHNTPATIAEQISTHSGIVDIDPTRRFVAARRTTIYGMSDPYDVLGFFEWGPLTHRRQGISMLKRLRRTHSLVGTPSNTVFAFYAEDRFREPLLRKLNAGDRDERADAAWCLQHYPADDVITALQNALTDPSHASMRGKASGKPHGGDGRWYPVRQRAAESLAQMGVEYEQPVVGVVPFRDHFAWREAKEYVILDVMDLETNWGLEPVEIPGYEPAPVLDSRTVSTLASNAPSSNAIPAQNHESKLETSGSNRPIFWTVIASFCSLMVGVLIGRQLATARSQKAERTEGP